ncbi:MAG: hypothetical protein ACREH4_12520 [Vitreimonas sp.]
MSMRGRFEAIISLKRVRYPLLLAAAAALFLAAGGDESANNWALGLSSEFAGATVIAMLIDQHFSILGIREHHKLDINEFCRRVGQAQTSVHVLDIWMKALLLTPGHRRRFEDALHRACRNGVQNVKFVIVDPDSPAAERRAQQLSKGDSHVVPQILAQMRECIAILQEMKGALCTPRPLTAFEIVFGHKQVCLKPEQVQIAFLEDAPTLAVHEADGFAYFAFFPANVVSSQSPQISARDYRRAGLSLFMQFRQIVDGAQAIAQ